MQEKEHNPITNEFINKFLLEAQSHSGLPFINNISLEYVKALCMINAPDNLLDRIIDIFVNSYMRVTHELYMKNKKWKSYDDF